MEHIPLDEYNTVLLRAIRSLTAEAEANIGTDEFAASIAEMVVYTSMIVNRNGLTDMDFLPVAAERHSPKQPAHRTSKTSLRVVK